jgi:iron-sulfur cluster repair protein YtfE (RIC family)
MDAIQLLTQDHEKVKQLFQQYDELAEAQPERKRELAEKIIQELMVHERVEEEIFYPAYRASADEEGKELVAEANEEHHVVDLILDELQAVDLSAEDFNAKFKVLKENVEHHIQEEEEEMFPDARRRLQDRLVVLGEEMMQYKEQLANQILENAPAPPDAPKGQFRA